MGTAPRAGGLTTKEERNELAPFPICCLVLWCGRMVADWECWGRHCILRKGIQCLFRAAHL